METTLKMYIVSHSRFPLLLISFRELPFLYPPLLQLERAQTVTGSGSDTRLSRNIDISTLSIRPIGAARARFIHPKGPPCREFGPGDVDATSAIEAVSALQTGGGDPAR